MLYLYVLNQKKPATMKWQRAKLAVCFGAETSARGRVARAGARATFNIVDSRESANFARKMTSNEPLKGVTTLVADPPTGPPTIALVGDENV